MSYVNNQGIRIHYETIGQGPPLVMQYGQYFPLEVWHEYRYVEALRDDFQLILVDARGHGDSAKIYEPEAYQTERMASDIISVLDNLGLEKAHYMGYSSGGYTGFVLAKHAQQRLHSLILGGTYPYRNPDLSNSTWHTEQIQKFEKQTTAEFVADLEGFLISQGFPPLSPHMKAAMLKHDLRALAAWHQACAQGSPACDDVPGLISVPCLIYSGENTGEYALARRAAEETRGAVFVGIPNGGHLEGGNWIDILRPHIIQLGKQR